MTYPRMYNEFAWLWPLISDSAGYANEAKFWRDALQEKLGPGRHHLLELGVGGGNNLSHLTSSFDATAVDLSEGMLEHSRRLNPTVDHYAGDMRSVRLGRTFDAVIIHDAISYATTESDLIATFETAAAHLRAGGVFVTAPDHTLETFVEGRAGMKTRSNAKTSLTMVDYEWRPNPDRTEYESRMVYLIRSENDLQVEEDRHVFGLFRLADWCRWLDQAGFDVEKRPYDVHDDHREAYMLVGIKR